MRFSDGYIILPSRGYWIEFLFLTLCALGVTYLYLVKIMMAPETENLAGHSLFAIFYIGCHVALAIAVANTVGIAAFKSIRVAREYIEICSFFRQSRFNWNSIAKIAFVEIWDEGRLAPHVEITTSDKNGVTATRLLLSAAAYVGNDRKDEALEFAQWLIRVHELLSAANVAVEVTPPPPSFLRTRQ